MTDLYYWIKTRNRGMKGTRILSDNKLITKIIFITFSEIIYIYLHILIFNEFIWILLNLIIVFMSIYWNYVLLLIKKIFLFLGENNFFLVPKNLFISELSLSLKVYLYTICIIFEYLSRKLAINTQMCSII